MLSLLTWLTSDPSSKYNRLERQLQGLLAELRSDKQDDTSSNHSQDSDRQRLHGLTSDILHEWEQGRSSSAGARASSSGRRPPTASPSGARTSTYTSSHLPLTLRGEDDLSDSGLPSLSNPLKLLVQASEDHAGDIDGRDDEEAGTSHHANDKGGDESRQHTRRRLHAARPRSLAQRSSFLQSPSFAPRGLYDADHDNAPELDPISIGILTLNQAQHLWSVFLIRLSHPLILLDPKLYTFDYVRPRSAMLLSVAVGLAARFVTPSPTLPTPAIAEALDKHILSKIIPTILLDGKRSVHIIKAFTLLAAYNGWAVLGEDRSFSYVSWAWSMCVELDLNRRMVSLQADPQDEMLQRKLRERERTYLLCWTYSFSIALHTGRRCSLSIHDPMIAAAKEWHHSPYALREDAGLVSNVQLRQLIARNLDYYTSHVAPLMPKAPDPSARPSSSNDTQPDPACRLLLDFHGRSITEDLDAWHATWVMPTSLGHHHHADRVGNGSTEHDDSAQSSQPFRLRTTAFYHAYASLILHSLPLRHGSANAADDQDVSLRRFTEHAQRAALSVIAFFLRLDLELLTTSHNSIFLTVGFAAVYALLRGSRDRDSNVEQRGSDSDEIKKIESMIEQVVERMEEAGRVTEHRHSFASQQAEFLRRIVRLQGIKRRSRPVPRAIQEEVAESVAQSRAASAGTHAASASSADLGSSYGRQVYPASAHGVAPHPAADESGKDVLNSNGSAPMPRSYAHSTASQIPQQAPALPQHGNRYAPHAQHYSDGSNSNNVFGTDLDFDLALGLDVGGNSANNAAAASSLSSGTGNGNGNGNGNGSAAVGGGPYTSFRGNGGEFAGRPMGGSPDALMDTLMMNNPIGLHLNSLLAPDPNDWGELIV